jgi:hypothetical protein
MAARELEVGGPVEYVVTLTSGNGGAVNLRCMGKVLRTHKSAPENSHDPGVEVAISLERYEFLRLNGHNHAELSS